MEKITISYEEALIEEFGNQPLNRNLLIVKLVERGYITLSGRFSGLFEAFDKMEAYVYYYPSRQDLIHKRFETSWIPGFKKRKEILSRKF